MFDLLLNSGGEQIHGFTADPVDVLSCFLRECAVF